MTEFSKRLRQLLTLNNKLASDLTRDLKLPSSTMSAYLNEDVVPRQRRIDMIAEYFGVDPAWLMGYNTTMKPKTKEELAEYDIINLVNQNPVKRKIMEKVALMPDAQAKRVLKGIEVFILGEEDE